MALLAGGMVLFAACSEASEDDSAADAEPTSAAEVGDDAGAGEEAASEAEAEAAADEAAGGSASLGVAEAVAAQVRQVIRTGDIEVVVEDLDAAADDVRRLAGEAGGFVADEQVRAGSSEVNLTVRVPAGDFDDVRTGIAEVGKVIEQNVQAEDVTSEVVDLESRIGSLRASVARLQGLLGEAGDVAQLAAVEGELARRETELESLLGQQRILTDQVDLATLTVHLSEEETPAPDEDAAGFFDGFRRGWVVAVDGGRFALAAAGFLLPVAIPAALVAVAVLTARRHIRRPA